MPSVAASNNHLLPRRGGCSSDYDRHDDGGSQTRQFVDILDNKQMTKIIPRSRLVATISPESETAKRNNARNLELESHSIRTGRGRPRSGKAIVHQQKQCRGPEGAGRDIVSPEDGGSASMTASSSPSDASREKRFGEAGEKVVTSSLPTFVTPSATPFTRGNAVATAVVTPLISQTSPKTAATDTPCFQMHYDYDPQQCYSPATPMISTYMHQQSPFKSSMQLLDDRLESVRKMDSKISNKINSFTEGIEDDNIDWEELQSRKEMQNWTTLDCDVQLESKMANTDTNNQKSYYCNDSRVISRDHCSSFGRCQIDIGSSVADPVAMTIYPGYFPHRQYDSDSTDYSPPHQPWRRRGFKGVQQRPRSASYDAINISCASSISAENNGCMPHRSRGDKKNEFVSPKATKPNHYNQRSSVHSKLTPPSTETGKVIGQRTPTSIAHLPKKLLYPSNGWETDWISNSNDSSSLNAYHDGLANSKMIHEVRNSNTVVSVENNSATVTTPPSDICVRRKSRNVASCMCREVPQKSIATDTDASYSPQVVRSVGKQQLYHESMKREQLPCTESFQDASEIIIEFHNQKRTTLSSETTKELEEPLNMISNLNEASVKTLKLYKLAAQIETRASREKQSSKREKEANRLFQLPQEKEAETAGKDEEAVESRKLLHLKEVELDKPECDLTRTEENHAVELAKCLREIEITSCASDLKCNDQIDCRHEMESSSTVALGVIDGLQSENESLKDTKATLEMKKEASLKQIGAGFIQKEEHMLNELKLKEVELQKNRVLIDKLQSENESLKETEVTLQNEKKTESEKIEAVFIQQREHMLNELKLKEAELKQNRLLIDYLLSENELFKDTGEKEIAPEKMWSTSMKEKELVLDKSKLKEVELEKHRVFVGCLQPENVTLEEAQTTLQEKSDGTFMQQKDMFIEQDSVLIDHSSSEKQFLKEAVATLQMEKDTVRNKAKSAFLRQKVLKLKLREMELEQNLIDCLKSEIKPLKRTHLIRNSGNEVAGEKHATALMKPTPISFGMEHQPVLLSTEVEHMHDTISELQSEKEALTIKITDYEETILFLSTQVTTLESQAKSNVESQLAPSVSETNTLCEKATVHGAATGELKTDGKKTDIHRTRTALHREIDAAAGENNNLSRPLTANISNVQNPTENSFNLSLNFNDSSQKENIETLSLPCISVEEVEALNMRMVQAKLSMSNIEQERKLLKKEVKSLRAGLENARYELSAAKKDCTKISHQSLALREVLEKTEEKKNQLESDLKNAQKELARICSSSSKSYNSIIAQGCDEINKLKMELKHKDHMLSMIDLQKTMRKSGRRERMKYRKITE